MVMSPLRMFSSWGSSSTRNFRRYLPTLVMRSSFSVTDLWMEFSSFMVRNLYTSNTRPYLVRRFCL